MASLRNENKGSILGRQWERLLFAKLISVAPEMYGDKSYHLHLYSRVEFCWVVTREARESPESSKYDVSTASSLQSRTIPPSKLAALGLLPSSMLVMSVEFGHQGKKENRIDSSEGADDGNVYQPYGEDGDGQGMLLRRAHNLIRRPLTQAGSTFL